jgi:AraC-like DNA-binding protein
MADVPGSKAATPFRIEVRGPELRSPTGLYGTGEARCAGARDGLLIESCYAHPSIGVVVNGEFDYRSPIGTVTAQRGTVLFGNAGEEFSYRYRDTRDVRRSVIAIDRQILEEVAGDGGRGDAGFPVAAIPVNRRSVALYGAVRRFAMENAVQVAGLLELVGAALRLGGASREPVSTRAERRRVLDVARHLEMGFADPVTLDEMADLAALSRYHFIRVFREVVGETPHKYLVGARLRAAADALVDSREPITSIALRVGFNDISNFNATFRSAFGMSPSAWRLAA